MYFPSFICKFSRGEEVVKAGVGVRCTTSNGTCSYKVSGVQLQKHECVKQDGVAD
jgi:hypothetical protein